MGSGKCSTYGGGEAYTWFWWGNLRESDHLQDPGEDEDGSSGSGMWGYGLD
jgi:hypothetical protein